MIKIEDKTRCCGCTACASACPVGAITMEADALGFRYPRVDMQKCIDCSLCEKVCVFDDSYPLELKLVSNEPQAFAYRARSIEEVESSTSGGAFTAISDKILSEGGVVYGAGYQGHFNVVHKRAETIEQRNALRKSKYVQSDLGDIFVRIKNDIRSGVQVMFTGTPCQCAGLSSFLGPVRDKALIVDIICHGVPSPLFWKSYLSWQEGRVGSKVTDVEFRDKSFGWKSHKETLIFEDGTKVSSDAYAYIFNKCYLRKSCGSCPYTNLNRVSDLTIADLWIGKNPLPSFALDNRGCSLVLCNTPKGMDFFGQVSDRGYIQPVKKDVYMQPQLKAPSVLPASQDKFDRDLPARGIDYVLKKYGNVGWRYKITSLPLRTYRLVRQTARKLLGKV